MWKCCCAIEWSRLSYTEQITESKTSLHSQILKKKNSKQHEKKRQQMLTKFLTLILFNGFSRSEFVSESKNDAILILISSQIEYEYYVYNIISNTKIWCHIFAPALSSTFFSVVVMFSFKSFFTENGLVEKTLNLQFDSKVSVKIHTLLNHVYGSLQKLVLFARSIWYIYFLSLFILHIENLFHRWITTRGAPVGMFWAWVESLLLFRKITEGRSLKTTIYTLGKGASVFIKLSTGF